MPVRAGRRRAYAFLFVLTAFAGCTNSTVELAPTRTRTPHATPHATPARGAETAAPAEQTTVLDAAPGAAAAIATSAALFRRAPVVLVAEENDQAGIARAAATAARLGAPVLLTTSGPQKTPQKTLLERELDRLSPEKVVAVGADAAESVRAVAGSVPVLDADSDLPEVTPPRPVDVTVLVDATRGDTAAAATAKAAGATVVPVSGSDPRADPKAVRALHEAAPKAVLAVGEGFGPADRLRARVTMAAGGTELPGGGQVVLRGRRIVCLYGHPGTRSLGVLGEQGVAASITRAKRTAAAYGRYSDVPVVPAFEIIATVAQGAPGPDGDFSGESTVAQLRPWVDQARAAGLYVVLDLQPGRADLLSQARRYEQLLRRPNVGLAVDPEWKLGPRQHPLGQIGGIDAQELNRTSAWLAGLTARYALPQKLFVIHQFRLTMIRHEPALNTTHDELSLLIHMDGQGSTAQKNSTWHSVVTARPANLPLGWKNFYDEDHPMLNPAQTMAKRPAPSMVSYQ
ncbi:MAG TPA: hypothetical protein VGP26_31955 [Actinophytocola sp.]|nr:hypothetical protein [Actinophytocola sp.]